MHIFDLFKSIIFNNEKNMKFNVKTDDLHKVKTELLIIPLPPLKHADNKFLKLDKLCDHFLSRVARENQIDGNIGANILLHSIENVLARSILLVGVSKNGDCDLSEFKKTIKPCIDQAGKLKKKSVAVQVLQDKSKQNEFAEKCKFIFKEFETVTYSYKKQLNGNLTILTNNSSSKSLMKITKEGLALANGIRLTKNLANKPANLCTPTTLANEAKKLSVKYESIKVSVMNESQMKKLKMNTLLSVAQGTTQPAKLITLKYSNGRKNKKPIVLVGKGVTFDSGGISLKPSGAMDEMKYDMAGAATVLGVFSALASLKLDTNVIGIIPATENMPAGNATKPGDVITSMSGKTVEILNTDAEGRLILCDSITYARKFNPEVVIDIATLTGACVVALGSHATGLMSNDKKLAKSLLKSGVNSNDRAWQLPLWAEYGSQLKTNFADLANVGGRTAGAITAGYFLSQFAEGLKWAHLDIAGTAWNSGANKSATGRPVGLLLDFLTNSEFK